MLDSNWRWVHNTGGYTNSVDGEEHVPFVPDIPFDDDGNPAFDSWLNDIPGIGFGLKRNRQAIQTAIMNMFINFAILQNAWSPI